MTSPSKQQEALLKSAEQVEKLVIVTQILSDNLKVQHEDNKKSQNYMLLANIIMALATIAMVAVNFS